MDTFVEITKKAGILIEALPYIQRFKGSVFVVKYGGAFMDDPNPEVRGMVAQDIAFLASVGIRVVVVHGGGKAINRAMSASGLQAKFLNDITNAFAADPELKNLIDAPFFKEKINKCLPSARKVAALAVATGIPVPTFMQAISYIDTMSTPIVGANLIQGLRDYFGAHTFTLVHNGETIHHNWSN